MRTKTTIVIFMGVIFVALTAHSNKTSAEVNVNIGIGVPLPHVVIHTPPPVVVIPGTYVYFAPDAGVDIFFFHGYWYRPHHGHWYRSGSYNGPWKNIKNTRVPHTLRDLPHEFRHTVRHSQLIQHADFKRNWERWERDKHWDSHGNRKEVSDNSENWKRKNENSKHQREDKHRR